MKKTLLLATALLGLSALNVSAALPPSVIPSGTTVLPYPGTVDISPNQYPLGVSSIGISFGGEVMKNPNNTKPAELYWNDFSGEPTATTLTTSIDMETHRTAGVIFSGTWTKNGEYKIVIPEGMFLFSSGADAEGNPTGSQPCPGMTLYYEIDTAWYPTPVDQLVVAEIEDIVLTFPDATEVRTTSNFSVAFGTLTNPLSTAHFIEGNRLIIKMAQAGGISYKLDTPGQYLLTIGAGCIEYVKNGVTKTNNEIRLTYHIPEAPEPSVYPYVDELITDGIEYFEITAPDGFDTENLFLINDRAANYLYRANEMGELDKTNPIAVCKALWAESTPSRGQVYLALYDPVTLEPLNFKLDTGTFFDPKPTDEWCVEPGSLKPWKPLESGSYCLLLSQGLYSGYFTSLLVGSTSKFVTSSPFRFYYDILGIISGVDSFMENPETEDVTVYTLSGIRVLKNAPKENLKNLPAGFYVVNGKKVVVK